MSLCKWEYTYPPALETDARRDYFAEWTQVVVDPKPGYCIKRLTSTRNVVDSEVTAITPLEPIHGPARVSLVIHADSHAVQDGTIQQPNGMSAGRAKGRIEGNTARFVWRGLSNRAVFFSSGIEFARGPESSIVSRSVGSEAVIIDRCPHRD
jgi:hypothetical protein